MPYPNPLKTHSFFQNLQWAFDPIGYVERADQEYPDIFTTQLVGFGDNLVFVNHPQGIQEILTNDRKNLTAAGEVNKIFQPLAGNYSMLMLDGDYHKRRRQIAMPAFHGERMRAYAQLIVNLTETVISHLSPDKPFSARSITQEISLQVILQAVFGLAQGERYQQLKQRLLLMLDFFRSPLTSSLLLFPFLQKDLGAFSPWGKFLRNRQEIERLLYTEIAERRQQLNSDRVDYPFFVTFS